MNVEKFRSLLKPTVSRTGEVEFWAGLSTDKMSEHRLCASSGLLYSRELKNKRKRIKREERGVRTNQSQINELSYYKNQCHRNQLRI